LGINSLTPSLSSTPVSILGAVKTFCHIAAGGGNQIIGITNRGRAWGWGANSNGQLGDGTSTSRLTPVSVAGAIKTFCKIAVGNTHALAITNTGRLWAWGTNASGQLGDNTTLAKATPVSVAGTVKTFCQIAAGTSISYGIDKYGKAWSWGTDTNGQLGTNTINESKSTPVAVFAANKTFCYIAAASSMAFAIDKNGMVWAWGNLTNGLNGANAEPQRTPIRVCNI
jgi:alpha-tubulin suppressor-like RCC1 family protein